MQNILGANPVKNFPSYVIFPHSPTINLPKYEYLGTLPKGLLMLPNKKLTIGISVEKYEGLSSVLDEDGVNCHDDVTEKELNVSITCKIIYQLQ